MGGCGGCASAGERCGNGLEKIYPTCAVRYGRMRHIGEFSYAPNMRFTCGAKVIISTERGIEIGEQVSLTCHGCDKGVSRDQMREYAQASGGDAYRLKSGRILREAAPDDLLEMRHIEDGVFEKLQTCRALAADFGLDMKVVDCEHIFGGERIVFYFIAEGRVDFRELVRRLAAEYQTRIEMRQIGARDEARLVADYETCGRECCCKNFLKTLKPITMSMAKLQMTTLDLSKVSGRCGRLKCCLRFEHEGYEELEKKLPRVGMRVVTNHGTGRVIDRQVLTQLVKLEMDDGQIVSVVAEDILERQARPADPGQHGQARPRPQEGQRPRGGERRRERPTGQPPRSEAEEPVAPETPPTDLEAGADLGAPDGTSASEGERPDRQMHRGRRGRRRRRGGPRPGGDGGSRPQPPGGEPRQ